MNVDEDDGNFNGKISLQNDEHDDNINLDWVYWANWWIWWEKKIIILGHL